MHLEHNGWEIAQQLSDWIMFALSTHSEQSLPTQK